jgi:hypothetical protein
MFGVGSNVVNKLVALGVSPKIARQISFLLGNPNSQLSHSGPVAISLPSGQNVPTNAAMAKNLPADASKMSPALSLDGQDYEALRVNTGATNINGSGVTVGAPSTFNQYVYNNFPVHFFDDIRMMGLDGENGGIFKFNTSGFGGVLARVQIGAAQGSGSASGSGSGSGSGSTGSGIETYSAQRLDQNGNAIGVPFTVYDPCNIIAPLRTCTGSMGGECGWAVYMSDRAAGGPTADTAVRPNIGGWDLVTASPPQPQTLTFTTVTKVCCYNGQILVCTADISVCAPGSVGAQDCGGGSCS